MYLLCNTGSKILRGYGITGVLSGSIWDLFNVAIFAAGCISFAIAVGRKARDYAQLKHSSPVARGAVLWPLTGGI
jgi:hypothetical protein